MFGKVEVSSSQRDVNSPDRSFIDQSDWRASELVLSSLSGSNLQIGIERVSFLRQVYNSKWHG